MATQESQRTTTGQPGRMSDPPACADELEFGEWLHHELITELGVETDPWAVEMVRRAAARLNPARAPAAPMEPVVLWMTAPTAFTCPGRYVYIARGLMHRACWEEAVAFAMAHEMAHHDLSHFRAYPKKLLTAARLPTSMVVAILFSIIDRWLNGPENEAAADARALDLCLAAGYDGHRCVDLFQVFEAYALDHGAIECVYGPEEGLKGTHEGIAAWGAAARSWYWHHRYGYPPIRTRKEALLARLDARFAGSEVGS